MQHGEEKEGGHAVLRREEKHQALTLSSSRKLGGLDRSEFDGVRIGGPSPYKKSKLQIHLKT